MAQMTTAERLVYMANRIARNFAVAGERAAALATADHIAHFWDPLMKQRAFRLAGEPDAAFDPIARDAVRLLATRGAPPPQSGATDFARVGEAGPSDAG